MFETRLPPELAADARDFLRNPRAIEPTRAAASVVVVRPTRPDEDGAAVRVWMQRRARSMAFAAGVWAFPGGGVDPADESDGGSELQIARRAAQREILEETGLRLSTERLLLWSRWVTPQFYRRRYDTWFFFVSARSGEEPVDTSGEADAAAWVDPEVLLAAARREEVDLFAPTRAVLEQLASADSLGQLETHLGGKTDDVPVTRTSWVDNGRDVLVLMPDDPRTPGDAAAMSLPPWCTLVRAPNPGPMTLSGTNSYVLDAGDGVLVVDPGPAEPTHRDALTRVVASYGKPVHGVILTHHHIDHTELAEEFARVVEAPILAHDVRMCQGASPLDEDDVALPGTHDQVRVRLTPGHTSDSLCLQVDRDDRRYLLTGDTVLGLGTTIVAHPDGALGPYLRSLRLLRTVAGPDTMVLPGHGPLRHDAPALIQEYLDHRDERLNQVRAALATGSDGVTAVTDVVYGDVDPSVRGAAEATVAAQLAYLEREDS
ncbi:MAG TPA: MBL fold metallo-hydrolase [Jiangellaceae bacterium]|nr:MBL fold metallo-hydrolase [Jiangellaceae bacterium]